MEVANQSRDFAWDTPLLEEAIMFSNECNQTLTLSFVHAEAGQVGIGVGAPIWETQDNFSYSPIECFDKVYEEYK